MTLTLSLLLSKITLLSILGIIIYFIYKFRSDE